MLPDAAHPERGRFVRDQVAALQRLEGLDVELYEFPPGAGALAAAWQELRRRRSSAPFEVVHAHFGLTAWPALALPAALRALTLHGTDLTARRTRLATLAVLNRIDLLATVSGELADRLPRRAAARSLVLPCGVDLERFRPLERSQARAELGLGRDERLLLFPADPARPEKRVDRARAVAAATGARLLTMGAVDPELVPLWVNAADAVLVPSEREGFGLAVLEALACDVPVLATPVGIHAQALAGIEGTLCAAFELTSWSAAAALQLDAHDPRVDGRSRIGRFSASAMAAAVAAAWRGELGRSRQAGG
jgi:glycosyltransferase involved in cell wall biosynthesis